MCRPTPWTTVNWPRRQRWGLGGLGRDPAGGGPGRSCRGGGGSRAPGVSPSWRSFPGRLGRPTLQVLDSDVADLSDELLALEPVPFVRSHEARAVGPGRRGRARAEGRRAWRAGVRAARTRRGRRGAGAARARAGRARGRAAPAAGGQLAGAGAGRPAGAHSPVRGGGPGGEGRGGGGSSGPFLFFFSRGVCWLDCLVANWR